MRIGYPMLYFLKFKILTCNFCAFSHFFYFSVSFYPIWMEILSKFRENVGLQAYHLGSVLNRSWTGLRTAVFSGLSQKNWEDRDRWSAWTGYSPVRFSVPFRSYEPDLEALFLDFDLEFLNNPFWSPSNKTIIDVHQNDDQEFQQLVPSVEHSWVHLAPQKS